MVTNIKHLTSTYSRFYDPEEIISGLLELGILHVEIDPATLNAYGWSDVYTACSFGFDYIEEEDSAQLPDDLHVHIDSGELLFRHANVDLDCQIKLQAYGAISGHHNLGWRYRWPYAEGDDVFARLIALNTEWYAEETALGLQNKVAVKPSGSKRGRRPKATETHQSCSSLELGPLHIGFYISGGA